MKTHLFKITSVLHALLLINIQRLNHYQMVLNKSNDMELKLVFLNLAVQSQSFCNVLTRWLNEYHPAQKVEIRKNFLAGLTLKLKELFFSTGRNSLVQRSKGLELSTLRKYRKVNSLSFLPVAIINDLSKQTEELEKTYQDLKVLQHQTLNDLQLV